MRTLTLTILLLALVLLVPISYAGDPIDANDGPAIAMQVYSGDPIDGSDSPMIDIYQGDPFDGLGRNAGNAGDVYCDGDHDGVMSPVEAWLCEIAAMVDTWWEIPW